ncbi:pentapeptide repeat-containing protein [Pseudoalteromonas luteoviolacea]|uniref:Pentapeptide repeat-containing protein n=1 Tax=Pseudoalteromonas luteoviolacea H33 TaxID=1365251 RepID=A0A167E1J6_9GAMM|nr:pentapeptide repeat-containing protein [Pseudoalteromonas luteoviolacea]KZN49883.1 hypothetical protein N476_17920 [Pseudoalteromonas luteoviolacea H33]KZN74797.1 hypothetical protein N477_21335 [Pseudoalteromonas luteoviolacea H33-S]
MEKAFEIEGIISQETEQDEQIILEGDEAILLWLEGKDAWNKWMEENPKAEVSFEGVEFSYKALKEHFPDNENITSLIDYSFFGREYFSFEGYRFNGCTSFRKATFSGEARFDEAVFSGSADFKNTIFRGEASFTTANFHDKADFAEANFSYTYFNSATFSVEAQFYNATFDGMACFHGAIFSGEAGFFKAKFSHETDFNKATFSREADFCRVTFSKNANFRNTAFSIDADFGEAIFAHEVYFNSAAFSGAAHFYSAQFRSLANFYDATFVDVNFHKTTLSGEACFVNAVFSGVPVFSEAVFSRNVDISGASFGDVVEFNGAVFESSLTFIPDEAENITSLDFKGSVFEKQLIMSGNFGCVPDLRQTKANLHVDMSQLGVHLRRTKNELGALREKAIDPDDAERLCRLKEIAESNKSQKRALAFHADEQRASRWGILNPWQSILDSLYSLTSNYGQSVLRPFVFLMMSIFVFSHITLSYADSKQDAQFKTALVISVATVTPFMAISKDARNNSIKKIFSDEIPESYYIYGYLHSFFSFIFIFLIGLGLRNRFRI